LQSDFLGNSEVAIFFIHPVTVAVGKIPEYHYIINENLPSLSSRGSFGSAWPLNFYYIRKMTVPGFTKKIRAISDEGDKNKMVCGTTNPL
jgi:hypothetical protein